MPDPTRGAIRTEITTSTDALVAGTPFTLFVTIFNPFEVPIILHGLSTYLPTEFVDDEKTKGIGAIAGLFGSMSASGGTSGTGDGRIVTARFTGTGTGDGRLLTSETKKTGETNPSSEAQSNTRQAQVSGNEHGEQQTSELKQTAESASSNTNDAPRPKNDGSYPFTLQPGNSKTCIFTLRTKRKMWFSPSVYKLNFDVTYAIGANGPKNSDTISKTLQVRSSLVSVAFGAAIGAFVGWVVSRIQDGEVFGGGLAGIPRFVQNLFSLLATVMLAVMSVIVIARKRDTQPIVSVEDVWGGVVVGFLVAYSGQNFLGNKAPTH